MSKVTAILETEEVVKTETTLVRPVSDMLKDGNSGPPLLFRHTSMQKIRHCCQNLNLFPYLLYSFDNSKSHPLARKVHLCLGEFLEAIIARTFLIYRSLRQTVLSGIHVETPCPSPAESDRLEEPDNSTGRFRVLRRQKRKQISLPLTLAVYLTPLLLAFQTIGLFSLMIFGKYAPGFIFLTTSLMFLGCISLRIMFHDTMVHRINCEKLKVQ